MSTKSTHSTNSFASLADAARTTVNRSLKKSTRRSWQELTQTQQRAALGAIALDLVLKAAAWHFLYHRPAKDIRGPKWVWTIVTTAVGTFGPLAFLLGGLKKH